MSDLGEHRARVDRALRTPGGPGWESWPEVAASPELQPDVHLSALLLLLDQPEPGVAEAEGRQRLADPAAEVLDRVRRGKLPWDAATAATALDIVRGRDDFDDRRVGIALGAAHRVCSAGEADSRLLDALLETRAWLDLLPVHRWRVSDMQARVRRVITAASPPALLDLSLLREGDGWGAQARDLARSLPSDEIAPLVRLLGDLGSKRPSQAWHTEVAEAVRPECGRALAVGWLRLAADAPLVPADGQAAMAAPGALLFRHGNDDLVRATVLAARHVTDERLPLLLGLLARRGATTSGGPGMTAALALKVATAAIDTLGTRGSTTDRHELRHLLEDLRRRDLVIRVALLLDQREAGDRHGELLRRERAADGRAAPGSRPTRGAVEALVRSHLAPLLREHGFTGTGTTFRRRHPDRVDLVAFGVAGGRLRLSYGTRFDAAHPLDEPGHLRPANARDIDLDIRLVEHADADEPGVLAVVDRLDDVVVPFLDELAGYTAARDHLLNGGRLSADAMDLTHPGSARAAGVLGLLALAAGDDDTAVEMLARRVAFEEAQADPVRPAEPAELVFWRDRLDRAARR